MLQAPDVLHAPLLPAVKEAVYTYNRVFLYLLASIKLISSLIWIFSIVVFSAVVLLSNFKLDIDPGFDVHIFAKAQDWL